MYCILAHNLHHKKRRGEGNVKVKYLLYLSLSPCVARKTQVLTHSIFVVKINSNLLSVSFKPVFSNLISGFVSNKISELNPVINNGNVLRFP